MALISQIITVTNIMSDNNKVSISLEYFPPKTENGKTNLIEVNQALACLNPAYRSCTFGAGGSTRSGTIETVKTLIESGNKTYPHISCVGSTKQDIRELLANYQTIGVEKLVVLRGDITDNAALGELSHASDLVHFIREETDNTFKLEVAGYPEYHPESSSPKADIEHLKEKVDAGADGIITQYFYNIDAYFHFLEQCDKAGIKAPITPGIMPITNYASLQRFSTICGAEIPRWIMKNLEAYQNDKESLLQFGNEVVTEMCLSMIDSGTQALHFYTLNRSEATLSICKNF
jgi:methylenetetrahydrofolate reductase (NADPH)